MSATNYIAIIYYGVVTFSYVREILVEIFMIVFRIQHTVIPIQYHSPVYKKIHQHATIRPGRISVRFGVSFPYGVFMDIKYRCWGYIKYEQNDTNMRMHIWAIGKDSIMRLRANDPNDYTTLVVNQIDGNNSSNITVVRVPRTLRVWQKDAIDIIKRVHAQAPDDALVCLITGRPNCGKSTIPLLLMREFFIPSYVCNRYIRGVSGMCQYVFGMAKEMYLVDEIDEIMRNVNNDKFAISTTKSVWNAAMDHVHMLNVGPIVILTSNNTYEELCEFVGEHAESMLRPGRIDVVMHVNDDDKIEIQRERVFFPQLNYPLR